MGLKRREAYSKRPLLAPRYSKLIYSVILPSAFCTEERREQASMRVYVILSILLKNRSNILRGGWVVESRPNAVS